MFMSVSNRSAAVYKKIDVETIVDTATPHKLVSLLFDALLQALALAKVAMERGDTSQKCRHINHAVRILEEGLIAPLDLEQGGEVAANLRSLYGYCVVRLTLANLRNEVALLNEVCELIHPVFDGWKQMNWNGQPA
jgi:flagellar protein FliS